MNSEKKLKKPASPMLAHIILGAFCLLCILPLLIVLSSSLSAEDVLASKGFRIIPEKISFNAYGLILKNPKQIINAYFISISVSAIGTFLGVLFNAMIAYPLSRKDFRIRNKISFYVFFTMLFSGGLVPTYILIINMNLKNTFWVLVLPYLVGAWYILMLRTFFQSIPVALIESAKIDGASEFGIFFKIVLPLSKSALATVGLLLSFTYWNDYWLGLLYITNSKLINVQYMFYRIISAFEFYMQYAMTMSGIMKKESLPTQSMKMALCVLTVAPMLCVFPFFQKYLVKGMIMGSVKG